MDTAIEFDGVSFTYDGTNFVLNDLNLRIERGTFVCVLGGNGSGKSTLAQHINALLVPDSGTVRTLGRNTLDEQELFAIRSSAGMVFQNPDDQIVASLIENDVAFGPENLGVPLPQLRDRVTDALKRVGLQGFEQRETYALSGGQKQRVAIAGVLAMQPDILVLDEASSMLDPRGRSDLMDLCEELHEQGMTIVMITHFMEEGAHAQRVVVLDAGRIVCDGTPEEVLKDDAALRTLNLDAPFSVRFGRKLEHRGVTAGIHVRERDLISALVELEHHAGAEGVKQNHRNDSVPEKESFEKEQQAQKQKTIPTPVIEVKDVWYSYDEEKTKRKKHTEDTRTRKWGSDPSDVWALQDVTFDVHKGEFLGIAGHTGSGKSTLIQHLNGLMTPTKGRVLVNGDDLSNKKAAIRARGSVGLVFQYPEHQLFASTVFDDVAFGPRNMGQSNAEVQKSVRDALDRVGLRLEDIGSMSPFELSGGQQRRVAFAGVLAMHPDTLVLDEPMAGLDPAAHRDFMAFIKQLNVRDGLSVVMVSHNMDDLAHLCDRLIVLDKGRLFAQGTPAQVFCDMETLRSKGLAAPHAQRLASICRKNGFVLPCSYYDEESLSEALSACLGISCTNTRNQG